MCMYEQIDSCNKNILAQRIWIVKRFLTPPPPMYIKHRLMVNKLKQLNMHQLSFISSYNLIEHVNHGTILGCFQHEIKDQLNDCSPYISSFICRIT